MENINRRSFITRGVAGLAVASAAPLWAGSESKRAFPVRLGGPVFLQTQDPEEIAQAHRKLGYGAAYCPSVKLSDASRIKAIRDAFAKNRVVIAEVGRWVNLMDADPAKRKVHLDQVTEGLALAEEVGALCCVDIAGSKNEKVWYGPHPDNLSKAFFDEAVENARQIIDAVKPKRAKFCYEMMGWALPDSVDSYLKMLKAVDRTGFGVHLDPCNLINSPQQFYRSTDLLHECFNRLGKQIVSCHAKDLSWEIEMNVHFKEVRPGIGALDYKVYLQRLAQLPHQPPLMMEHLSNAQEYDQARLHIMEAGKSCGVEFA